MEPPEPGEPPEVTEPPLPGKPPLAGAPEAALPPELVELPPIATCPPWPAGVPGDESELQALISASDAAIGSSFCVRLRTVRA